MALSSTTRDGQAAQIDQGHGRGLALTQRGRAGRTEGRPGAGATVDADGPAHEFDQALANGQAEAGATVLAGGRGVDLGRIFFESRLRLSSAMPMPVSRTAKRRIASPSPSIRVWTEISTSPAGELMALPARLVRIWRSRPGSPRTMTERRERRCR